MYLDRWFMTIVCSCVLTLNGVYIVQKLSSVNKLEIGVEAYNRFTTTMLIHSFVLLLFMSSLIAVVYVFNRLKKAMDHKIKEAIDARLTEQKLFAQATIDGLTGAYNRRHFVEKVREQLNETSAAYSLLLLDIDDFKQVNDVHGHLAGDQVLVEFSNIMKQVYAGQGIAGRVGGEEFAVFLLDKSEEESQAIAERLRETIGNSMVRLNEEKQITVTVSGGIAYAKRNGMTFEELFQQADKALYTSKKYGKNKITLAESM
jgi:diguanylate cyclase (GGDEF)-like protein